MIKIQDRPRAMTRSGKLRTTKRRWRAACWTRPLDINDLVIAYECSDIPHRRFLGRAMRKARAEHIADEDWARELRFYRSYKLRSQQSDAEYREMYQAAVDHGLV